MPKKQKIDRLQYIRLKTIAQMKPENIKEKLLEFIYNVEPVSKRSEAQNSAMHVNFTLLGDKLNDMGLDQRKVLKPSIDIPWTNHSIKKQLWLPIMESMTNKTSTTELEKNSGEIDKIHAVLMRHLGEKFSVEYHEFPHDKNKQKEAHQPKSSVKTAHYPENNLGEIPF